MADIDISPLRKGVPARPAGGKTPTWVVISQPPAINNGVSEFSYHTDKWILTPSFRLGVNILKNRGFIPN